MIEQFPEMTDSGFWYVVPVVDVAEGDAVAESPDVGGLGYVAWYGDATAAVCVPRPLASVPPSSGPVSSVIAESGEGDGRKPAGRISLGWVG